MLRAGMRTTTKTIFKYYDHAAFDLDFASYWKRDLRAFDSQGLIRLVRFELDVSNGAFEPSAVAKNASNAERRRSKRLFLRLRRLEDRRCYPIGMGPGMGFRRFLVPPPSGYVADITTRSRPLRFA